MNVADKLATTIFNVDREAHITVQNEICVKCEVKPCLTACPAENFTLDAASSAVVFSYEGCLECGTCKMVCSLDAVNWSYPKQGNGVLYRFG